MAAALGTVANIPTASASDAHKVVGRSGNLGEPMGGDARKQADTLTTAAPTLGSERAVSWFRGEPETVQVARWILPGQPSRQ